MPLSRGEILIDPEIIGTGGAAGNITFIDGDETNTLTLRAPTNITANYNITFPAAAPAVAGYYLQSTDTAGTLVWSPVTASAAGANSQIQYNSSGNLAASSQLTFDPTNAALTISGNTTTSAEIRFTEDSDNGSNYAALKAAAAMVNSTTYTWPDTIGAAGQVLKIAASPAPSATGATLFWDAPVSGTQTATGNSGDVQITNGSNGFTNDIQFNYNTTSDILTVGSGYAVGGTTVLTSSTLGTGVVNSSLTNVGTLTSLQVDNININGNVISSTNANGIIDLSANGSGSVNIKSGGATAPGRLHIFDNDDTNSVNIIAPATLASDVNLTLPSVNPEAYSTIQFPSTAGIGQFVSSRKTLIVSIDGGGNVIQTGTKAVFRIFGNHQVLRWNLLSNTDVLTGQIFTVDVDITNLGGYPTTLTQFSPTGGATTCSIRPTFSKAEAFNLGTAGSETGGATNALWTARGTSNINGFIISGDILVISVSANTSNVALATFELELAPIDYTTT